MADLIIDLDFLAIIVPPIIGACIFIGRYFWKKEQCFRKLSDKINELSRHDEGSLQQHDGFEEEIAELKKNHTEMEKSLKEQSIYLKLLLNKFNIPYD